MKIILTFICLVATAGVFAQGIMAPLPDLIIISPTNQSASVTIIRTIRAGGLTEDYVKQKSIITNLQLSFMSAKSVTTHIEKDSVLMVCLDVTVYEPTVVAGKYGEDQKLLTSFVKKLNISYDKSARIQVNGEILNADKFAQRFKLLPAPGMK